MKVYNSYIFGDCRDIRQWTAAGLEQMFKAAHNVSPRLKKVSSDYIISVLDETGRLFAEGGRYRSIATEFLCAAGYSPEKATVSLNTVPQLLSAASLRKRMNMELFIPHALEVPIERSGYEGIVRAYPRGVVLHIGAGNSFYGVLHSLVIGFLTKNVNIVKLSSSDTGFLNMFMQALKETDVEGILSAAAAVISWKGGSRELEETAVKNADVVMVWGGEEAVKAYRSMAPVNVKVEGFGPETSLGLVYESAINNEGMRDIAERAARDASLWNQASSASLNTLYIIAPAARHEEYAREFVDCAADAFAVFSGRFPQGRLFPEEMEKVEKARRQAAEDAGRGLAYYKCSAGDTGWTVIYEKDPEYRVSPQNRVLYVKTVETLEKVLELVMPLKGYLQTAGVAGSIERVRTMEVLEAAGVSRIVKLGKMLEEAAGSPHDGVFPMMSLVKWIPVEEKPSQLDRISRLVSYAQLKSPFYAKHLAGIDKVISMEDFRKLPFLSKEDVLKNTPPESNSMLTGPACRGIFFAATGSGEKPGYIFYDQHEYEHTCRRIAYNFQAAGLDDSDIIANLFTAGDLRSVWLSFEKAVAYTKAVSVPACSQLSPDRIIEYLKTFRVTAIAGMPSAIVKLAEAVKQSGVGSSLNIKKIFCGGKYIKEEDIRLFRDVFGEPSVKSIGYISAEAGAAGYQCPHCGVGVYHLFSDSQFIEIVSPETGENVSRGEKGEIIVTCLSKKIMPVIRYRTGDRGRWLRGSCRCGREDPRFEILPD
jgi:phenylacetate-coenzyme A ligase PaaK-like adenylate-forming protein